MKYAFVTRHAKRYDIELTTSFRENTSGVNVASRRNSTPARGSKEVQTESKALFMLRQPLSIYSLLNVRK